MQQHPGSVDLISKLYLTMTIAWKKEEKEKGKEKKKKKEEKKKKKNAVINARTET